MTRPLQLGILWMSTLAVASTAQAQALMTHEDALAGRVIGLLLERDLAGRDSVDRNRAAILEIRDLLVNLHHLLGSEVRTPACDALIGAGAPFADAPAPSPPPPGHDDPDDPTGFNGGRR